MTRLLIILFFFISFYASAQSHLGKSKDEILKLSKSEFKNIKFTFDKISEDSACIRKIMFTAKVTTFNIYKS